MMHRQILLALSLVAALTGAEWRQFRGTDSSGVAPGAAAPAQFGPDKNIAWKAELPGRGPSSPIVVGGKVIVTAAGGPRNDRLSVVACDAQTGKQLWQRTFWATGPVASHPKTTMAAPTPASDGKHVVALFASNDLVCLDLDGRPLWLRSLYDENSGATDGRGLAASPVLVGDTVVVQIETQNTSFAAGIDLKTGASRWRVDRPKEMVNWSSPIALPGKTPADALVLLQGNTRLSACDPATGREVWGLDRKCDPIASSVIAGNVLYVPGEPGLAAYALTDRAPPKLLWEQARLNPTTASPLVLGGHLYCLRGAILLRGDLKTGEVRGQLRLKGPFSSSPVSAGGLLYCFNETGVAQVVKPAEPEDVVVETNELGETVLGTPALADGALYLRTERHLWKIAKP